LGLLIDAEFTPVLLVLVWAILETSVVPAPTEAIVVPLMVTYSLDPVTVIILGTVGGTLGALIDYVLGLAMFEALDRRFALRGKIEKSNARFRVFKWFGLPGLLFVGRIFPLGTLKPIMLLAGSLRYGIGRYVLIMAIATSIRYFIAANGGVLVSHLLPG